MIAAASRSTQRDRLHRGDLRSDHAGVVHRHRNPGLRDIVLAPGILAAFNPFYALSFLIQAPPLVALAVLGATFLAVTGGEAMYADMGHFGRGPIRLAWFGVVLPGLFLNYFGQGALLLVG